MKSITEFINEALSGRNSVGGKRTIFAETTTSDFFDTVASKAKKSKEDIIDFIAGKCFDEDEPYAKHNGYNTIDDLKKVLNGDVELKMQASKERLGINLAIKIGDEDKYSCSLFMMNNSLGKQIYSYLNTLDKEQH